MAVRVAEATLRTGVRVPYAETGEPGGVPLVLLHAYADSWRSYERVLGHLPGGVHALAPTQRGHGDADRPDRGYSVSSLTADLAAFLDFAEIERAVLVGNSSSSFTVERLAVEQPERVMGVALIGAPFDLRIKPGISQWAEQVERLEDPVDVGFVRGFVEGVVSQPMPREFAETMVAESAKVPARVWRAAWQGLMEAQGPTDLARVTVPTLLLWGALDELCREDQTRLATDIPDARLVVYPGTGHIVHWERPQRVAADLAAFAAELAARERRRPAPRPGPTA